MSRSNWLSVLIAAFAWLAMVAKLIAEKEYSFWSYHVAARSIRIASFLVPRSQRKRRRLEWLAELDEIYRQGQDGALSFASFVLVGATWIGARWVGSVLLGAVLVTALAAYRLFQFLGDKCGVDFPGSYLMRRKWEFHNPQDPAERNPLPVRQYGR